MKTTPRAVETLLAEVTHELGWLDERASTGAGPMSNAGSLPECRPDVTQEYAGLDVATQQDMPNRANQVMCPNGTRAHESSGDDLTG